MHEYLSGLIRVLEKRLIDQNDLDRMVLASSAAESFGVLNDTDYADNLADRLPEDYNLIIEDDLRQLKILLEKNLTADQLAAWLFMDFDWLNIKAICKQLFLGTTEELALSDLGTIDPELLRRYISALLAGTPGPALPNPETKRHLKKIVTTLQSQPATITPTLIDTVVDLEMWAAKRQATKKLNDKFISDLLRVQIDFLNTKILLRSVRLENKQNHFIAGGYLTPDNLWQMLTADKSIVFTNLRTILEQYKIVQVLEEFNEHADLWKLELDLDRYLLQFAKERSKFTAAGSAIVVAYFLTKVNAGRNLRLIMSSKLNELPNQQIAERVIS